MEAVGFLKIGKVQVRQCTFDRTRETAGEAVWWNGRRDFFEPQGLQHGRQVIWV
jgi:hypothetical protein